MEHKEKQSNKNTLTACEQDEHREKEHNDICSPAKLLHELSRYDCPPISGEERCVTIQVTQLKVGDFTILQWSTVTRLITAWGGKM